MPRTRPQGRSLHLAATTVDRSHYVGWNARAPNAQADAQAMYALAAARGFRPAILIGPAVTTARVKKAVRSAAAELVEDDFFLLTYSGHGAGIFDLGDALRAARAAYQPRARRRPLGDLPPRINVVDAWAFYDRMLLASEFRDLLSAFAPGVRVVVVADACFSGHIVSAEPFTAALPKRRRRTENPQLRRIPPYTVLRVYLKHRKTYDRIDAAAERVVPDIAATGLLVSASRGDDEAWMFNDFRGGLLTHTLIRVLGEQGSSSYHGLLETMEPLVRKSYRWQRPQLVAFGDPGIDPRSAVPFKL